MNMGAKILMKILANQMQQHFKQSYSTINWDLFQKCKFNTTFANQ